jgi:hypothetical protein
MRALPINAILKKENKLGTLGFVEGKEYAMYKGLGDESDIYYLTDKNNPKKIYMMVNKDLWHEIFITIFEQQNPK